mmetsp:Transcript_18084/g.29700  ORF Transcript_18084/g.29700 Transcript_18084/m.29700 type:complete len:134 (+) Transcript_18084:189-590(+)
MYRMHNVAAAKMDTITYDMIMQHFTKPIQEACRSLGIGATTLKKLCRRYGVKRWPYRKIQQLDKGMQKLQQVAPAEDGGSSMSNVIIQAGTAVQSASGGEALVHLAGGVTVRRPTPPASQIVGRVFINNRYGE